MRSLYNALRTLLARLDRRNAIYWLIALQAFVLIADVGYPGFAWQLMLDRAAILDGELWRLGTWVCVPASTNLMSGAIILHFTFLAGRRLEEKWGAVRLTGYLATGALATASVGLGLETRVDTGFIPTSLLFAFAIEWPDEELLVAMLVPMRAGMVAVLSAAVVVYRFMDLNGVAKLIPIASVANVIIFFWPRFVERLRVEWSLITSKSRRDRFKAAQATGVRKCAVCGARGDDPGVSLRICTCDRCGEPTDFCVKHAAEHGAR